MGATVNIRDIWISGVTGSIRYFAEVNGEDSVLIGSRTFSTTEELIQTLLSTIYAVKGTAKTISISKKSLGVRMFLRLPSQWQVLILRKLTAMLSILSVAQTYASELGERGFVNNAPEITLENTCENETPLMKLNKEEYTRWRNYFEDMKRVKEDFSPNNFTRQTQSNYPFRPILTYKNIDVRDYFKER